MGTWVEHIGHTSFAIARGGVRIAIDPIVVRSDLEFRHPSYPQWFSDDLSQFSAIFISHGHNDHLHPPSLLGFPEDTQIYFFNESRESCSCDEDPDQLLQKLGFTDIRPFNPGSVIELGEDIRVRIIPAQNSSEGEEQCCFLIETPDVLMLDAVDIKDAPVTRQALEPYRSRIDVALIPMGAALQWQGFWNQMDVIEAVAFCGWLQPIKVAVCGGALSLSARPRPETLERYPNDLADWLGTAGAHLGQERLLRQRPPFRMFYDLHRLLGCRSIWPASRFRSRNGPCRTQAVVTVFFTGYHPWLPHKKLVWPDSSLQEWLGTLQGIRPVVGNSLNDLRYLLERCDPSVNHTPAGMLAPCTLRRLVDARAFDLAAQITAFIPETPSDPSELGVSFYAVVEAMVRNSYQLPQPVVEELQTCVWIDRNMFRLQNLYLRLRSLANLPEGRAQELLEDHIRSLRGTVDQRRPVLGPHHFWLDRDQIHYLIGTPPLLETVGMLCYASPAGVHKRPLLALESMLLELCDGRRFTELVEEVSLALDLPAAEVREPAFEFLAGLARDSVLLINWSQ